MKPVIKDLGKVCITPEGDWDIKKEYANLSIVFNRNDAKVYISKQCVPKDIDILNTDYWNLLVDFDSIVNDMTTLEIKNYVDNAIKEYIGNVSDEYSSLEKISEWINTLSNNLEKEVNNRINSDNDVKSNSAEFGSFYVNSKKNDVEILYNNVADENEAKFLVPAATEDKAGVMSADDKKTLTKNVAWDNNNNRSNMNDFTTAGVYNITGQHTRTDDNLPILNTGGGHSFNARLTVLDSSITGSGNSDDKCITQVLSFCNRLGQGEVYIRTGKGSSLDSLTWEKWSTLQRNANVGQVDNLDNLKDNGIYSGVWTKGSYNAYPLTFVCIVINDYFVGVAPRRISQFVYGLSKFDGSIVYQSRVWDDSKNAWGDWEILNQKKISSMISTEIKKVTDGVDPEKLDSLKDLIAWVDTHGGEVAGIKNDIQANEAAIETEAKRAIEAEEKLEEKIAKEKNALVNGDTIVGQAREIHSRNGKTVADSFLARTTAGSGTIGDGVASLKSVGGNIVKNLVDGTFGGSYIHKDVKSSPSYPQLYYYASNYNFILNHVYYFSATVKTDGSGSTGNTAVISINNGGITQYSNGVKDMWHNISIVGKYDNQSGDMFIRGVMATYIYVIKPLVIDLTEMFGAGKEPDKATCDKLFGTMDALPQGLTVANPTTFTSTGFNQFNPESVLEGKAIVDNAIVSGDKKIAVIPCLPCKVGVGENNGYCIHGEFGDDIKVYLIPLNPMEVEGELYMHELTKDSTTDTYVPQIRGYLLVEVPTTANLCAHFLWSEDKCKRDTYEPYFESKVELPTIPQMSEWGLAGIQSSGTLACDEIDFERGVYVKRIGSVDFGSLNITKSGVIFIVAKPDNISIPGYGKVCNAVIDRYSIYRAYTISSNELGEKGYMVYSDGRLFIKDTTYTDVNAFKQAMQGVMLYYELATPEEYPLPKVDNNYISSDYGAEQFNSVVPCNANNLYYMRSLAGETRNFLDRMYNNIAKTDAKEVADYITNGIEGNKELAPNAPNLALRALFVAAGAEYNDTNQIIQKTAPWGTEETWVKNADGTYTYSEEPAIVDHLPKHYYLNGLGDITEEQMIEIYNISYPALTSTHWDSLFRKNSSKDIIPRTNLFFRNTYSSSILKSISGSFYNSTLEVIRLVGEFVENDKAYKLSPTATSHAFVNCRTKHVIGVINLVNDGNNITNAGSNMPNVRYMYLHSLKSNLPLFTTSKHIEKRCILYIIQNATPTSAITITLHPDAYARIANQPDILAALEAQPLITLVSA